MLNLPTKDNSNIKLILKLNLIDFPLTLLFFFFFFTFLPPPPPRVGLNILWVYFLSGKHLFSGISTGWYGSEEGRLKSVIWEKKIPLFLHPSCTLTLHGELSKNTNTQVVLMECFHSIHSMLDTTLVTWNKMWSRPGVVSALTVFSPWMEKIT